MSLLKTMTMIIAASLAISPAYAKSKCDQYIGHTVAPQSFEDATRAYSTIKPKGEFETTAQYESRLASYAKPTLFISGKVIGKAEWRIKYDADHGGVMVVETLFQGGNETDVSDFARDNNLDDVLKIGYASSFRHVLVSSSEDDRQQDIIFDDKGGSIDTFKGKHDGIWYGPTPMSPAEYEALQTGLKVVYVATLKAPYFVQGMVDANEGVHDIDLYSAHVTPTGVNVFKRQDNRHVNMLVANLQCALVTDNDNVVQIALQFN